jgi:RNA polymerase sigma factor (sigma-70 family)
LILLWPSRLPESPYDSAALSELEDRLEAAIASLPPMYREVLLLVGVEQFRPAEAARVCGISPEALRQRLSRARGLVSQYLQDHRASIGADRKEMSHDGRR